MIFLYIYKYLLRLFYFFLKLRKQQNKVLLISRVNAKTSIDFRYLKKELDKEYDKVIILNHKSKNVFNFFINNLVETAHLSNSKAAIIDSYILPVSVLKHRKNFKVIQIWHALGAIKKFGYDSFGKTDGRNKKIAKTLNMHHNYDFIIASGKKQANDFKRAFNYQESKIKITGTPKINYLLDKNILKDNRKKIKDCYNLNIKKETILYAPTFRKDNNINYDELIKNVDFKKYNLIIKKHPLDRSAITKNENIIIDNKFDTLDFFSVADYLITDYSSLSIDAAILDIKTYFYIYDYKDYEDERGLNINFIEDYKHITFTNINNLLVNIEGNNYNKTDQKKFKENYVKIYNNNISKEIIDLLKG